MKHARRHHLGSLFLLVAVALITGCSSLHRTTDRDNERGVAIVHAAAQLVGTPYHFGGADTKGFDCSGLVVYVHERVGLEVPRTADEQKRAAHPVALDDVLPGDLVFFYTSHHIGSRRINHVGIYMGDGRFIHAPRPGGTVSYANLTNGYYRKHFASAGRFWDGR